MVVRHCHGQTAAGLARHQPRLLEQSDALAHGGAVYAELFDELGFGADGIAGNADDINLNGRNVARAPDWSGNVAFDWSIPFGDALSLGMSGNMTYSGKYFTNNASLLDYVQKSYATFDGRISFGARDDQWRIALVGVNLADKIITQTSGGRPFLAPVNPFGVPVGDDFVVNENRGRQVFVEASVKF